MLSLNKSEQVGQASCFIVQTTTCVVMSVHRLPLNGGLMDRFVVGEKIVKVNVPNFMALHLADANRATIDGYELHGLEEEH